MAKTVELQLTVEHAELLVHALRDYQVQLLERILSDRVNSGYDQPGQLAWLATYIEHKLRDAR